MKLYTGKTLDECLNKAAKEKDVSIDALTYFIKEDRKSTRLNSSHH